MASLNHQDHAAHAEHRLADTGDEDLKISAMELENGDRAANLIGNLHIDLTEEDNKRILRKTDRHILTVLVWVYFLQTLDKSVLGYGAIYGLREDTNLSGSQYSLISSMNAIAQLVWLPFSSWLIVRVPHRILLPSLAFGWGLSQAFMGACTNFGGLVATRFFLGLFEAACLPLFSVITSQWYRRAEQPLRVAFWYGTNGMGTIIAASLSFGLSKIDTPFASWRILFIFVGILTVLSAPVMWWLMDSDIPSARFLTENEKLQAAERLRANQTGTGTRHFRWRQALEALLEIKTWLFVGLTLCVNCTAHVTNAFGPTLIAGFGFDSATSSLLNIPFGFLQILAIVPASYLAYRLRIKSLFIFLVMLPVLAGSIMLYYLNRDYVPPVLAGYYMLAFLFGSNPLIVSWIISNIAGSTKRSVIMVMYNIGTSSGNMIGPLLFNEKDAPRYESGLTGVMGITAAAIALIGLQILNLFFLNKRQEKKRVAVGKPAKLHDYSMKSRFTRMNEEEHLGENAFKDMTDKENEEFIFVY